MSDITVASLRLETGGLDVSAANDAALAKLEAGVRANAQKLNALAEQSGREIQRVAQTSAAQLATVTQAIQANGTAATASVQKLGSAWASGNATVTTNAAGMVRAIQATTTAMQQAGPQATAGFGAASAAVATVGAQAQGTTLHLGGLARSFMTLIERTTGANVALTHASYALGAVGGPGVGIAAVAGIGLVAGAYALLTADARKAEAEITKSVKALEKLHEHTLSEPIKLEIDVENGRKKLDELDRRIKQLRADAAGMLAGNASGGNGIAAWITTWQANRLQSQRDELAPAEYDAVHKRDSEGAVRFAKAHDDYIGSLKQLAAQGKATTAQLAEVRAEITTQREIFEAAAHSVGSNAEQHRILAKTAADAAAREKELTDAINKPGKHDATEAARRAKAVQEALDQEAIRLRERIILLENGKRAAEAYRVAMTGREKSGTLPHASRFDVDVLGAQAEMLETTGDQLKAQERRTHELLKPSLEAFHASQRDADKAWRENEAALREHYGRLLSETERYQRQEEHMWADLGQAIRKDTANEFAAALDGRIKTFRDFGEHMLQEIRSLAAKMAAEQALTKGAEMLGNLFGGFGGAANTTTNGAGVYATGNVFHEGGIVGAGGTPSRSVPASVFAGAPRFHAGGMIGPGEVPVIAERGELIIPKGAVSAMRGAAGRNGRAGSMVVHQHFNMPIHTLDGASVASALVQHGPMIANLAASGIAQSRTLSRAVGHATN